MDAAPSTPDADLARRLAAEREFHNRKFGETQEGAGSDAIYELPRVAYRFYESEVAPRAPGARVLEFGCGDNSYAPKLNGWGATVTSIDISDEAIEETRRRLAAAGREATLIRMNAEELDFPDASFDLVIGRAILHHLDLDKAYAAIARVLRPGGTAIFLEPLAHNALINLYRRFTPHLRTEDEHPLTMQDLRMAERHFGRVQLEYFTLLSMGALVFAKAPRLFEPVKRGLDRADHALFRAAPFAGRWAWTAAMVMEKAS
jgi:SAM-dependent methyltransferase